MAGPALLRGWALRGWWLSLLAGGTIAYFVLVGKWKLSMITLSAVLVAAPIADAALGLAPGLCVAFLGLTADQLIATWAAKRRAQLGLV